MGGKRLLSSLEKNVRPPAQPIPRARGQLGFASFATTSVDFSRTFSVAVPRAQPSRNGALAPAGDKWWHFLGTEMGGTRSGGVSIVGSW
jgi:hypothetical protein